MNYKQIINHKCRTCYNDTKVLKSLTKLATDENQPTKSYAELLMEIAHINTMDDKSKEITQSICGCCSRKLKAAYTFVLQAQEVNEKLLKMLDREDDSKIPDCLEELQVDIPSCLEIKMEVDDIDGQVMQNDTQSGIPLKMEEPDVLKTDDDSLKTLTLNDTNNSINLCIEIPVSKNNENILDTIIHDSIDSSDDEVSKEDNLSEDSEWQEETTSKKKTNDTKSFKTKTLKNEDVDKDIAAPCNQCKKIFNNSKALACHLRNSHITEEQKCACTLCDRKFTRPCNLYKHMRTSHGPESVKLKLPPSSKERKYQCDKCPRNYTKKSHLNGHKKDKHSNENESTNEKDKEQTNDSQQASGNKQKRYEQRSLCSFCGNSFASKSFLIIHMRSHTGERPFKCDQCERAYPRLHDLTVHKRIHTGEKPYVCKLCGKAFRVCNKLSNHMRSHTDIRPYKCKECERSFKYSKDLNIHSRIHTGERPYCCTVCGSTFTQSNSLKAHRTKLGHMEADV